MPLKDPQKRLEYIRAKKLADPEWHERMKQYWRDYSKRNRPCKNENNRKWRERRKACQTPEQLAEVRREWKKQYYALRSKNPDYNKYHSRYTKDYRARLKKAILDAYGAICVCCGETMAEFLTPDHINGGGSAHLKRRGTIGIYLDIVRAGFPKDEYRILCMNCNWARSVYGVCPHASKNK